MLDSYNHHVGFLITFENYLA